MGYAVRITIVALGYIATTVVAAYLIKVILGKYESDVGISGLTGAAHS